MKASPTSILFSLMAAAMLTACQSNTYRITGTAEGLADGDTLFITADLQTGVPTDTLLVSDGRFEAEGVADSVHLCMVYSASRNEINAPFFAEPGSIQIKLTEEPGGSRVSGTHCNNEWQRLNDGVMTIGREINNIAEHIYGDTVSPEEQKKGMDDIDKLNKRFAEMVVKATEDNIGNEFGYFLLTYYPEELIDNATRSRLIKRLPEEMRSRHAIRQIEAAIKKTEATAEGQTISDFTQTAPDGTALSAMSVVSQNRLTVIDFWASWCAPCRQEMPFMVTLYNKYKDRGLGILGVSLDSDRDAWLKAIGQMGMAWPQMSDLKGWENEAAQHFNVTGIPHTIVVDAKGKILRRGLRGDKLEQYISEHL